MIRRIEPTEHQIQSAIIEWTQCVKISLPPIHYSQNAEVVNLSDFIIAIPNGGKRSLTEGLKFKREGVKKGVSDLFLACPQPINRQDGLWKYGLWIEVKRKNGKLSKEQKLWFERMKIAGYSSCVVYSVDEGINAIKDYLGIKS